MDGILQTMGDTRSNLDIKWSECMDGERISPAYGPSVTSLKAFCWKVRCLHKLKLFLWQLLTRCIAVKKKLRSRGMQGDTICVRCGAPEESINHVFFECPQAIQVWALSRIPTNLDIFPTQSLFTNMDHLFWRVSLEMEDHHLTWILWYI